MNHTSSNHVGNTLDDSALADVNGGGFKQFVRDWVTPQGRVRIARRVVNWFRS